MKILVPLTYVYNPTEKLSGLFAKALTSGLIDIKDRKRVPPNIEFSFPAEVYVDFILRNSIPHEIDTQDGYHLVHRVSASLLSTPAPFALEGTLGERFINQAVYDEGGEELNVELIDLVPAYRDTANPDNIHYLNAANLRTFLTTYCGITL